MLKVDHWYFRLHSSSMSSVYNASHTCPVGLVNLNLSDIGTSSHSPSVYFCNLPSFVRSLMTSSRKLQPHSSQHTSNEVWQPLLLTQPRERMLMVVVPCTPSVTGRDRDRVEWHRSVLDST